MPTAATVQTIQPGDRVEVMSMTGPLARIAKSTIVEGTRFPVVWVCREEEWTQAINEDREPDAVPWPAEDVSPALS
jgi:hypothetical protein